MTRPIEKIEDIPAAVNVIENGVPDPEPEKGRPGRWRRVLWSALKGIFTTAGVLAIAWWLLFFGAICPACPLFFLGM